jgi:beta-glucosidase
MTLEEKIGQMTQAEHGGLKNIKDVEKYYLGSVLSGGNSDPENGNGLAEWTDLYDTYQKHALKTRLGIPLLYGVDALHGEFDFFGRISHPVLREDHLQEIDELIDVFRADIFHRDHVYSLLIIDYH